MAPPGALKKYAARKAAAKGKMASKAKPKARRGPKTFQGAPAKAVIRQQNLGQQTASQVALSHGKGDSRAAIYKAVSPACRYVCNRTGDITTGGYSGRQAWQSTDIAFIKDLSVIGNLLSVQNVPTAQSTPPASYMLESCQHNLNVSNVGQGNVKVEFIHCRAKRDLYTEGVMDYTTPTGTVYQWDPTDPETAVQQGVEAARTGPSTGGVSYLVPGIDETESPIFNAYFKILKRTEVFLAVGGTHRLQTNCKYNRVLDATVYASSFLAAAAGVTDFILMKAQGQTGVQDGGAITIAACQVAYTENWDYSFVQVQNSRKTLQVTDSITSNNTTVDVISGSTGSGMTATGLIA